MHCDAHDVVALQLDFAGVQPAANSDAERLRALCDRRGAADRADRPIKRCEEAVPKCFTSRPRNRAKCSRTVWSCWSSSARHSRSPSSAARRVDFDDIGEHDGRQYAIRRGFAAARTGQELFDRVDDAIAVTGIGKMIAAG